MKPASKAPNMDPKASQLIEKVKPLAREIVALNQQAKAMGIFTNHRDLAECKECQLFEDVSAQGILFVYHGEAFDNDTGLRFKEIDNNAVQCPGCGKVFCPYEAVLHYWPKHD